ncbi:MAG TPA: HD domain-containing protein [Elusimicrobiales bacterium]|nr:HD domain-containing protein [Elusimicrobiales bacterium]HOL63236.1 HD domain-containing protein [Elusimicrobiales bacterium]HPO95875.1 HD domain-containing protein [Elusimicrobiales bacterium]
MTRSEELEYRLNLLVQFGAIISKETNLTKLLEVIAGQVEKILSSQRCSIFIYDHKTNELWSRIARGLNNTEIRVPVGKGIVGWVADTGQSLNIEDAYKSDKFNPEIDRITKFKTKNVLAVPLKNVTGRIIGVFEVINKNEGNFNSEDEGILNLISSLAAGAIENAQLYESLYQAQLETIYRLAVTAEYRDQHDTAVHLRHISEYSALIARAIGLDEKKIDDIKYASPLHDIGKVAISDSILLKPAKLTDEEFEEMKKHTLYGAKILSNAKSHLLQIACRIAQSHHEKYDGNGYPYKLKGEQIPIEAKIVSVADVFDALCMTRVYKPSWEPSKAREYILSERGKSFDPLVVDAFDSVYDKILELQKKSDPRSTIIPGIRKELYRDDSNPH